MLASNMLAEQEDKRFGRVSQKGKGGTTHPIEALTGGPEGGISPKEMPEGDISPKEMPEGDISPKEMCPLLAEVGDIPSKKVCPLLA